MIAFNISRITLSNKEKEQVLNKWKDKLGIPNTELSFQGHLIPFLEENGMFKSAQTEWDNENKKWIIRIFENTCKKSLIHEYGHILLEKKLKFRSFGEEIDKTIFHYCNYIIDSFADYELCKYQEYYQLIKNLRVEDLEKPFPENNDIKTDLGFYFLYYTQLNHLLKENEKRGINTKITNFLSKIENLIAQKDKNLKNLEQLKALLDKFTKVKDSNNILDLRSYIFAIINHLHYFEEKFLKTQLDMIFQQVDY